MRKTVPIFEEQSLIDSNSFDRTLGALARRSPFRSFIVELVSGTRVEVDHPEALVFRGGVAVYIAPNGTPTLSDHEGVSQFIGVTEASG